MLTILIFKFTAIYCPNGYMKCRMIYAAQPAGLKKAVNVIVFVYLCILYSEYFHREALIIHSGTPVYRR